MSESATAGPWRYEATTHREGGTRWLAHSVFSSSNARVAAVSGADNARQIAAVPDLLEKASAVVAARTEEDDPDLSDAIDDLEAAITQAGG